MIDSLDHILNYTLISPHLSTAGQPEPQDFPAIRAAGYQVVISLVPPVSPEYLAEEAALVAQEGLEFIHIPVIWSAPTRADLEQFFAALDSNRERRVFAHCVMNFRASAFVFLYQVLRLGLPVEPARRAMHEIWDPNPTWEQFIAENLPR